MKKEKPSAWLRLANVIDALSGGKFADEFREAAIGEDIDTDSEQYRRLSQKTRDLAPLKYKKVHEMAFYLWQRNPLAQSIIQIMLDFCVGDEFTVNIAVKHKDSQGNLTDVNNEEPQGVWDKFCKDPVNKFYSRTADYYQDLLLFGELIMPTVKNEVSGSIRIGYITSQNVEKVNYDAMGIQIETITMRDQTNGGEKTLDIIRYDLEKSTYDSPQFVGDVFYFQINKVLAQSRGHSELITIVDWLDALDQFMFDVLEGAVLRNSFFYHYKMTGADDKVVEKVSKDITHPKPGSIKVTNEKVEIQAITPDLKAIDTSVIVRMFKNFILASKRFPEHWFSDGGNTNLATAGEMSRPVLRMLKRQQERFKDMVKQIVQYVVLSAPPETTGLKEGDVLDIDISVPKFDEAKASELSTAFTGIVNAVSVANQHNWISDENAKKAVDMLLTMLGIEVDESESVDDIKKTDGEKDVAAIYDNQNGGAKKTDQGK